MSGALSLALMPLVIWNLATPDKAGFKNLDRTSTIMGIDRNHNGIRDDIEKHIDKTITLSDPKKLLNNFVKYSQATMVGPDKLKSNQKAISYHLNHSLGCLINLNDKADRYTVKPDNYEQIAFLKKNPDKRSKAEKAYDLKLLKETRLAINIAVKLDNILGNTKAREKILKQNSGQFEQAIISSFDDATEIDCNKYIKNEI